MFAFRYVHNNIFFSFAVDADLDQLSKKRASDSTLKGESTNSCHKLSEKASSELPSASIGVTDGEKNKSNSGENVVTIQLEPDLSAETQMGDSEQATYASANNDLKGTKAYQEADVPGLYNLAMAIIDYRGHRVVAQVGKILLSSFAVVISYNFES